MFQIRDTIVSREIIEEEFVCDLRACKGDCCIEGESGAPLEEEEAKKIEEIIGVIWDDLSPQARDEIKKNGIAYRDCDGDLVTSIINGENCVFTYYDEDNICKCAIEKAYREGKTDFYKPISCHLYPIRLKQYKDFVAINYHRWSLCQGAIKLGKKEGIKIYRFLKEPLVRRFGQEWYDELCTVVREYYKEADNQ